VGGGQPQPHLPASPHFCIQGNKQTVLIRFRIEDKNVKRKKEKKYEN
jgi:hypothetical protein